MTMKDGISILCRSKVQVDRSLSRLAGTLLALTLVTLLLRVYHLGKESLWLDETASWWIASKPLAKLIVGEPTNPPLYYLLLHWWILVFGAAEVAVRWLSVLPSAGAVFITYVLARRLFDGRVAMLTAAFMAISSYHIYYAQEARAFALLLFLGLGSTLSLHIALARAPGSPSLGPWLSYVLLTIAALYTHFHAVFLLAAHNLVFMLHWRDHRTRLGQWITIQAIVLVAFAPWLVTMLEAAATTGGQPRRYLLLKLPQAVVSLLVGDTLVPFDEVAVQHIRETLFANLPAIVAFTVGFGVYFASAVCVSASRRYTSTFCWVMFLVPLLLPFLVSFRLPIFDRRYVIVASPLLYMLLAAGALNLHDLGRHHRPAMLAHGLAALLVGALCGLSLYNYYFNPRFGKEEWREAVAFVEMGYAPQDLVVFDPEDLSITYRYYSRQPVSQLALPRDLRDEDNPGWRHVVEAFASHKRVWLIRSHLSNDAVLPRLRRTFPTASIRHFSKAKGIDVYLLQR